MNKVNFSEIESILSRTNRSANVAELNKHKIISAYRLPDFSEMDAHDSENLRKRITKLNLTFEPKFVIQIEDGLIIFDEHNTIRGYTYNFEKSELFSKFEGESDDTPSHAIGHIMEMQRMMNQNFRRHNNG